MDLNPNFVTFTATDESSAFPIDRGRSGIYELRAWDYERMMYEETHIFDPQVKVYIPAGHVGRIEVNPEHESMISVTKRALSGGMILNLLLPILMDNHLKYMVNMDLLSLL